MSDTIDCPYCEHEHEPTGSHEDDDGQWECHKCEKEFEVLIEYDPMYSTSKIPCPKDVPHVWGEWDEWSESGYSQMEIRGSFCVNCDKVRIEKRIIEEQS